MLVCNCACCVSVNCLPPVWVNCKLIECSLAPVIISQPDNLASNHAMQWNTKCHSMEMHYNPTATLLWRDHHPRPAHTKRNHLSHVFAPSLDHNLAIYKPTLLQIAASMLFLPTSFVCASWVWENTSGPENEVVLWHNCGLSLDAMIISRHNGRQDY